MKWIRVVESLREVESKFGKAPENCTQEDLKMVVNQLRKVKKLEKIREREERDLMREEERYYKDYALMREEDTRYFQPYLDDEKGLS